jgi:DNA phosphorothioation system restriction enzyme
VCNEILNIDDIDAIVIGVRNRSKIIRESAITLLDQEPAAVRRDRLKLLTWLVAMGAIEFRIAFRSSSGRNDIYHEKLGIFRDKKDDSVVFTGSANESFGGLSGNFESVDVFRSWISEERRRVDQKRLAFEHLWGNNTAGLEVMQFHEAASRGLLKARSEIEPETDDPEAINAKPFVRVPAVFGLEETLLIPSSISLREHQKEAIKGWFDANGHGIFQMATGSGKTIAALAAAVKLFEWASKPILIVIVCPYLHLCAQWVEEAKNFGLDPLLCAINRSNWMESLSTRLFNLSSGTRTVASIVVSNSTFASDSFQALLKRAPQITLLIIDEVHNVGAADLRKTLPQAIPYRIGLSATPERLHDVAGTEAILNYFGQPVIHYSLQDAISDGVLCTYRYNPILVKLEDDELDEYLEATKRIARLLSGGDAPGESQTLDALILKRARLLATCRNKIPALVNVISPLRATNHNLIYCGDGTVEQEPDSQVVRQIDAVARSLGRDLGMSVAKYVADTPLTARNSLRKRFAEGELQGLIAIRCLDEGVDIPETRRAFILASSTNPRQFIQRRGRLLRRSPGKDDAEIFDFIVRPSDEELDSSSQIFPTVRSLFRRELNRIVEFAELASNGPEAMRALLPIRSALNLLDYGVNDDEI